MKGTNSMTTAYVLDMNGQPLMPTSRVGKVYRLLKNKKAKVIRKCPFTIKLLYEPEIKKVQECNLGVDTGSSKVGFAVYSNGKILYQSQVELRNDIFKKMDDRREFRKLRRSRKLRYRPSRLLNRKNSRRKDRFSPTMISKFNGHIREIEFIKSILPISKLILETGKFDTTLLKHEGEAFNIHWGYQKGTLYGFSNAREYILERDNYTCQICKGKSKDSKLEVHHIQYRSENGSNNVENLICLCSDCHHKLHKGEINLKKTGKSKSQLKYATQMNSIRIQLLRYYQDVIETFGFITKQNRLNLNLSKDHYIDACVIASCGNKFIGNGEIFYKKSVLLGDRRLMRGSKILPKRKILGFNKFDKIKYKGNLYFIKGRRQTGLFELMDIFGEKLNFENPRCPKAMNFKLIQRRKINLVERKCSIPVHT